MAAEERSYLPFSPFLPLLFPSRPLYLHIETRPFSSARFLFSEEKEKPKENGGGRVQLSAFFAVSSPSFSFLPLYLHMVAQPFSSASPPPRLVFKPAPGRGTSSPFGVRDLRPVVFFQGKEESQKRVAAEECSFLFFRGLRPILVCEKMYVFFFQRKMRIKRRWQPERVVPSFFATSVPSFSFREKGKAKGKWKSKGAWFPSFPPFFRRLFQKKKKKRKVKRQMTSGAQTSAFPLLFPLFFLSF